MADKIIVIGGKGSAVVVAEQIYDAQQKGDHVEFLGFAFDDEKFGDTINGFPVLSKTYHIYDKYKKFKDVKFLFQMYRPDLMQERIHLLKSYNIPLKRFGRFVHPSSLIAKTSEIGFGTAIMANCVVNPGAIIGNFCTIHSNTLIGHDTKMFDHNFIAAHNVFGSNNKIGTANFFGLNSTFNNYIEIGDYCFIGMSSNVIKSIKSYKKVYGNPAKEFITKIKPL